MESLLKQLIRGNALFFIVVLGIGGSFQNGFHVTGISSPSPHIQSFINSSLAMRYGEPPREQTVTLIWSAVVSLYAVGGFCGSVSVRYITSKLGRKKAMIWNNVVSIVAATIMIASKSVNSFEMILAARFLYGFTAGLGANIHTIYLGESSPKKIRGMVTLTSATFVSMGKLSGQFAGLREVLGREECWNFLLSVPTCFSVIQLLTLPFFPEAPRYLLIEKGNSEQCKQALQSLWGPGEYGLEVEEMQAEQAAIGGEHSRSLLDLLGARALRWQLLTMVVVYLGIQFCGITAISVFSYNIFLEAGIPVERVRYVTLGVGVSEVLTSITCGFFIESVGRRALLWGGFGAMSVIMAFITVTLHLKDSGSWIPYSTVCLIFLFVIFYGGGPANQEKSLWSSKTGVVYLCSVWIPLSGVGKWTGVLPSLTHEIFIQSYRPAAFVFTGMLRWLGFAALGLAFPFLITLLRSPCFILFSCVCLTAGLYIFFVLPETKGKTVLEISEEFKNIRACGSSSSDSEEVTMETRF